MSRVASWQNTMAGCVLVGALVALAFAPAALAAQAVVSLKTGPVATTVGPELEVRLGPQVALALSAAAHWEEGQERSDFVLGGLRYFFRPEGNRWLLTAYAGGVRPGKNWFPLGGAALGYEWNLHERWRASVEFGVGVTVGVALFVPVPVPVPLLGAGVGYRF